MKPLSAATTAALLLIALTPALRAQPAPAEAAAPPAAAPTADAQSGAARPAGAQPSATQPSAPDVADVFGETLDVQLVTVPFTAVDRQGQPVYDLRRDEVELWLDGQRIDFDYFDRYGAGQPVALAGERQAGAPEATARPTALARSVFFLFDVTFSTPRGLVANRDAATRLVAALPESDRMYLIVYASQTGLQQKLGPLAADAPGKQRIAEAIAALQPNVDRVRKHAYMPSFPDVDCDRCISADNMVDAYRYSQEGEKTNYQAVAADLADSLEFFATFLRQLQGPKLVLYLTQGIDTTLYNNGLPNRFPPIRTAFERPLRALGESGAMLLYVNGLVGTDADLDEDTRFVLDADAILVNDLPTGETTLQEMSEVSGGKVVQHPNTETLKDRIVDWTSAYYEVGFQTAGRRYTASPQATIRVTRPGVEVWSPKWAKTRRDYRQLDAKEKRFLIADLVLHGPQAQAAREVSQTSFFRLDGSFDGKLAAGERALTFAAQWPQQLRLKALELYSVVLAPGENLLDAQMVAFHQGIVSPSGATTKLDVSVPGDGRYVWGIVAVDAADSSFYLRRMLVEPDGSDPASVSATGR
jgi:VWFA-related protein